MTHADIKRKFMIEYDKADVTSSFPSLTDYEICTILDKAYLALISGKVSGSNFRKTTFEADIKSIEDMRPLIMRTTLSKSSDDEATPLAGKASNECNYKLPSNFFYYVDGKAYVSASDPSPVSLITHSMAQRFACTDTNNPWIPTPVAIMENGWIILFYDKYKNESSKGNLSFVITYIKKPQSFVERMEDDASTKFELNDHMAEELIDLAVITSLETVESQRLSNKLQTSTIGS